MPRPGGHVNAGLGAASSHASDRVRAGIDRGQTAWRCPCVPPLRIQVRRPTSSASARIAADTSSSQGAVGSSSRRAAGSAATCACAWARRGQRRQCRNLPAGPHHRRQHRDSVTGLVGEPQRVLREAAVGPEPAPRLLAHRPRRLAFGALAPGRASAFLQLVRAVETGRVRRGVHPRTDAEAVDGGALPDQVAQPVFVEAAAGEDRDRCESGGVEDRVVGLGERESLEGLGFAGVHLHVGMRHRAVDRNAEGAARFGRRRAPESGEMAGPGRQQGGLGAVRTALLATSTPSSLHIRHQVSVRSSRSGCALSSSCAPMALALRRTCSMSTS